MLKTLIIAENSFEPDTWEEFQTLDVCEFLALRYGESFPQTARIYHQNVSQSNDVTPTDQAGVSTLQELEGRLYVIVYPEDPLSILVAVVAVAASAAAAFLLIPKIPSASSRNENRQSGSPNNELSDRRNSPRINQRIPDIYGTVRSTPDLIAVPYKVFVNHEEVEFAFMCVGRGEYEINRDSIQDDTTPVSDVAGASVEVFGPFTSPNSGSRAQVRVGSPINEPVYAAQRNEAVNGQVLRAPNASSVAGDGNIYFVFPDEIRLLGSDSNLDFTDYFSSGDTLNVSDAITDSLDLSGTYSILSLTGNSIVLANPASVNSDWDQIQALTDGITSNTSAGLDSTSDKWIGPFTLNANDPDLIVANFVAVNGLYKDDGRSQTKTSVEVEIEVTPINEDGNMISGPYVHRTTIEGSATIRSRRAATLRAAIPSHGTYRVRARRVSEADLDFNGNVVDEVQWRDVYLMRLISQNDFGNVTTVQSVTYATSGALAVKNRKLSMEVTRKIPARSGQGFTEQTFPTKNAADILCHAALDPFIGGRKIEELNLDSIYGNVEGVIEYFGSEKAGEFSYTFDSSNLSFEETAASIASAVFSTAYRRGNVINMQFERRTENSTLLFNHRNKLPGSEKRSINFGRQNNHDGVEYEWVDPSDDAVVTIYVPDSITATNPKKVESIGVRNKLQAHFHAQRIWQKIQYQNIATEFQATQEAELLVLSDRILVADNTRTNTFDGDILRQEGLSITLSQPFKEEGPHTMFLQHSDGTVESARFALTGDPYVVTLQQPPRLALVSDDSMFARTVYQITPDDSSREHAFLVTEKSAQGNFTYNVLAINYDERYYSHDSDLIEGVVNVNGDLVSGT